MEVNADFDKRVLLRSNSLDWVPSPMAGVDRRMLDRIGGEVARATSIVRYAPDSHFSAHVHEGGEEFIVLDGVFQDEHGDYPAGSYIRNPPTTRHTPGAEQGCIIFVKLWQFDPADRTMVKIDMNKTGSVRSADRPGVSITPLFQDARETVQMEVWDAGVRSVLDLPGGAELLVLEGVLNEAGDAMGKHDWLRLPIGAALDATADLQGARIWIKTGGLRFLNPPS